MQQSSPVKSFLSESALWTLSNALCVSLPVAATYLALHIFASLPMTRVSMAMSAVAILSLTWGSWSALVWTRNRMLRASMRLMTTLPGLLLLAVAGFGFYVGRGSMVFWIALLGCGVGTIATSFMLAGRIGAMSAADSAIGYLAGLGIFPVLATGGTGAVGYLWYLFVSNPLQTDWRTLFSFSFFFVTTLAVVLISTVIPAVTTLVCRRIAAANG